MLIAMRTHLLRRIRIWIAVFIVGLVVSGVTAFPLETELRGFAGVLRRPMLYGVASATHLLPWVERVRDALVATNAAYPFLAYGTDWLAFAHLVIAVGFCWAVPRSGAESVGDCLGTDCVCGCVAAGVDRRADPGHYFCLADDRFELRRVWVYPAAAGAAGYRPAGAAAGRCFVEVV